MCGRYTLLADEIKLKNRFSLQTELDFYKPSYNIAPSQQVFAVIHDGKNRRAGTLRWGLIPSWKKETKNSHQLINARSETVHMKPSFRHLLKRNRCLIIADSFYEWKQAGSRKIPMRIQESNENIFAFAGLWDKWSNQEETIFTCTILTRDSNQFMQNIHHRMPIIFSNAREEEQWLKSDFKSGEDVQKFLHTIAPISLKAHEVSDYVNNYRNNDEKCIATIVNE